MTAISGFGVSVFLFFSSESTIGLIATFCSSIAMLIPIAVNASGNLTLGRKTYLVVANLIISSLCFTMGTEPDFQFYMLNMVGTPLIFFNAEEKVQRWLWVAIPAVTFVIIETWAANFDPVARFTPDFEIVLRQINNSLQMFFLAMMFYFFAKESDNFVQDLADQRDRLETSNIMLDEALLQAKEATRMKSMFLANMSHEIRTPLNGIIVAGDVLKGNEIRPENRELVDVIGHSSKNLLSLINDVLDLSKAESDRLELDQKEFDLFVLMEDIMKSFKFMANEKQLELITFVDPRLPRYFVGDEMRLRQILTNLVGNSIKFSKKGYVLAKVLGTKTGASDLAEIEFRVEDSGIGIPKESLETIFDSFTQVDGSSNRKYGGTGLGTTISKMLVERMGGNIQAISPNPTNFASNDPGSQLVFNIPLKVSSNKENSWGIPAKCEAKICILAMKECTLRNEMENFFSFCKVTLQVVSRLEEISQIIEERKVGAVLIDSDLIEESHDASFLLTTNLKSADAPKIIFLSRSANSDLGAFTKLRSKVILKRPFCQSTLVEELFKEAKQDSDQIIVEDQPRVDEQLDLKILLAEDNLINQQVAKQLLSQMGCEVDIAENGLEALAMCEEKEYDLILMDHMMPKMDGVEATIQIRQSGNAIPIIALTANALLSDREKYFEAGMDDYLSKPVIRNHLIAALKKWGDSAQRAVS